MSKTNEKVKLDGSDQSSNIKELENLLNSQVDKKRLNSANDK